MDINQYEYFQRPVFTEEFKNPEMINKGAFGSVFKVERLVFSDPKD